MFSFFAPRDPGKYLFLFTRQFRKNDPQHRFADRFRRRVAEAGNYHLILERERPSQLTSPSVLIHTVGSGRITESFLGPLPYDYFSREWRIFPPASRNGSRRFVRNPLSTRQLLFLVPLLARSLLLLFLTDSMLRMKQTSVRRNEA